MEVFLGRRININVEVLVLWMTPMSVFFSRQLEWTSRHCYLFEVGEEVVPSPIVLISLAFDDVEVAPGVVVSGWATSPYHPIKYGTATDDLALVERDLLAI